MNPPPCYLLLPMGGKQVLWVQAPNKEWMLLAGKWNSKTAAESFAQLAGYFTYADKNAALEEIEAQLQRRVERFGRGPNKYRKEGCPSPLHCMKTPRCKDGCEKVGVGLKRSK